MKYFIRALKSMLYFILVFVVIVGILYFLMERPKGLAVTDMFQEGSLVKLAVFFVIFGAVYPAVSFFKRKVFADGDYATCRSAILDAMDNLGYKIENETETTATFRQRKTMQRMMRLFGEDRITLEVKDNTITVEGYRKDVMRIVSSIAWNLRKE